MKISILFFSLLALGSAAPLAHADEVKVFAAASLTDVLQKVAKTYEAKSGDKLIFNFAGSNVLARQIVQGAPAQLFFSADEAQMNVVDQAGLLVAGSRKDLLSNRLVLVVPATGANGSLQPRDLAQPEIKRLALADPLTVPAGVYAKAYLVKLGLWDSVQGKVIPTQNVRAALAAVASENADAGIVYRTDAKISQGVKVTYEFPASDGPPIAYPIALLKGSSPNAAAQKFLDYLQTPAARDVFTRDGFIVEGK